MQREMIAGEAWLRRRVRYPGLPREARPRTMPALNPQQTRLLLIDCGSAEDLRATATESLHFEQVADVAAAEALLKNRPFDAILLDLTHRNHPASSVLPPSFWAVAQSLPVIALCEDEADGEKALLSGAAEFLLRPHLTGFAFRRALHHVTERSRYQADIKSLRDEILHHQRITDALSASQNRMMAINECLYEGILVFDEHGYIALSNPAADRLLGDGHKLTSRPLDQVLRLKEGGRAIAFAEGSLLQVIRSSQGTQNDDAVIELTDGRNLAVAYACSPLLEKDGVQGAILSVRDIGAFKQAQRDALQSSKLASVGSLAAGIAHEINTPIQYIGDNIGFLSDAFGALAALLARAERLLGEQPAHEAAMAAFAAAKADLDADYLLENIPEATRQSLEGVAQVARIVLAMKEFSHPGERAKTEEDVNRAIENTLAVSRNEWKYLVKIETDLAADLPRIHCLAGELNQVFLNLIVNATHAIEEADRGRDGKIVIRTRRQGDHVEIIVEDNGVGMSETVRSQIFDPFFTTKRVGKGTGQGLAICRDVVVSKHGGRILVDSTPGVGSRFSVILPIKGENTEQEDQGASL